jgi:hypothetical protein
MKRKREKTKLVVQCREGKSSREIQIELELVVSVPWNFRFSVGVET